MDKLVEKIVKKVNAAIKNYCDRYLKGPDTLISAMKYSLDAGGKRIRPVLVILSADVCGGDINRALIPAVAIEAVHTFSLIHDDLPAMDNDDFRRGKPTSHKVFGEAVAILAGDGLLSFAFELISGHYEGDDSTKTKLIYELSTAIGPSGVIGGQTLDIEFDSHSANIDQIAQIHRMKTASLIRCACRLGAISAEADSDKLSSISEYGYFLGLAFQLTDDLLDITSTVEKMGKNTGKDKKLGRPNYALFCQDGVEGLRKKVKEYIEKAKESITLFDGTPKKLLLQIADFVSNRSS